MSDVIANQMPGTVADRLINEMMLRRKNALELDQRSSPQANPRASNIHDCARNIVYQVLDWDKKKTFDHWTLARFKEGKNQEKTVIDEIRSDGFDVIDRDENGQLTISIPEKQTEEFRIGEVCTGSLDGLIFWEGVWLPMEIKSIHPNTFKGIKSLDDFRRHPLYRKWPRQLLMYMYGKNKETGIFVLSDCLGHRMYIPVYLDYGEAEWILKHLEKAARHIKAKTYPDRIPYDRQQCDKCQFMTECLPDSMNKEAMLMENEELEAEIAEHEELKTQASRYRKIHDNLKATFKSIEKLIVGGRFLIQNLPSRKTVYNLTPEAEAQIEEIKRSCSDKVPTQRLSILDLNKKTQVAEED